MERLRFIVLVIDFVIKDFWREVSIQYHDFFPGVEASVFAAQ